MDNNVLLKHRQQYVLKLPKPLERLKTLCFSVNGKHIHLQPAVGELKQIFPRTFDQPLLKVDTSSAKEFFPLKVGVILSGGQASGGHNVIIGIYDALKKMHAESQVVGFLNGPSGLIDGKYQILERELLHTYRNTGGFDLIGSGRTKVETDEQLQSAFKVASDLKLDGIVIIGGDDSNTNGAVLAEYFLSQGSSIKVIGVPKTIDGDLQNALVPISFGFDTACKVYAEMIGNLARDCLSAKKYTHFVKLMGRTASHIALECALKTHPNLTFIGEEIAEEAYTLERIIQEIADLICKRAEKKKNYGIILIPEGLIEFIPEMKLLIEELTSLLLKSSKDASVDAKGLRKIVKEQLASDHLKIFEYLPNDIQDQLLLDRDPHGNVRVSQINTEKMLLDLVQTELKKREIAGSYKGSFSPVAHFFGYEGRSGFPSNFDATYCYALGFTAAALIQSGYTGYMACISDLHLDVEHWSVWGLPLVKLMHIEMRKGKKKPVIAKALVNLEGKAFRVFKEKRERWMLLDEYGFPGPTQYFGDPEITDTKPITMMLERS